MRSFPTETTIAMGNGQFVFSSQRVIIRTVDESAGPYLCIRGINDEPGAGERPDEFYLLSHAEIDEFCELLHGIMRQSETPGDGPGGGPGGGV